MLEEVCHGMGVRFLEALDFSILVLVPVLNLCLLSVDEM